MNTGDRKEVLLGTLFEAEGIEIVIRKTPSAQRVRRGSAAVEVPSDRAPVTSTEDDKRQPNGPAQVNAVRVMLGIKQVLVRVPFSRATLLRLVETGGFPKPCKIASKRIAWFEDDILAWQKSLECSSSKIG